MIGKPDQIKIVTQVCVRLYKANQRVRDPELDNLLNIHEVGQFSAKNILDFKKEVSWGFQVKHWMDPQIIPYGWGLFSEGEEVRVIREGFQGAAFHIWQPF